MQVRVEVAGPRGKAAFARQLGISPTTYQSYERDRIAPADVLVRIADVAQVDLRWLLTGHSADGAAPQADHPALQRAAALLAKCSNAAAPLAAFVDLLAASMLFPAKPAAQLAAATPTARATLAAQDTAQAPSPEAGGASPEAPADTDGWIPILGRSAAGTAGSSPSE